MRIIRCPSHRPNPHYQAIVRTEARGRSAHPHYITPVSPPHQKKPCTASFLFHFLPIFPRNVIIRVMELTGGKDVASERVVAMQLQSQPASVFVDGIAVCSCVASFRAQTFRKGKVRAHSRLVA